MRKRMLKGAVCVMLSAVMIGLGTAGAAASMTEGKIEYKSDSGYVATKITHPDKGVQTADGIVDYTGNGTLGVNLENGEGDRGQNYSWVSAGYGDYVYIGTCYGAWTSTLQLMKNAPGHDFDDETMLTALDTMFHGAFYTGEEDGGDPKGILVKINVKTGEAKILMSMDTTGSNVIFRNAVRFRDDLYFCGSVNTIPCIYKVDPETDECTQVYAGMTLEEYMAAYQAGACVGIRGMCVFEDKLIISCITKDGAIICESENPTDQESFRTIAVNSDLFDYPAYHYSDSIYGGSIFDMIEFGGSLYVSICTGTPDNMPDENTMQSFAVVRGDRDSSGEWTWTSVVGDTEKDNAKYTFGIDPERTRSGAAVFMTFGDYLYIGEYNDEEIAVEDMLFDSNFDFINANLEQSVNLYRMDQDENVELIVGDADEMFPEGGKSGFGSGFDRHENQYIWRMAVYDGRLYVGTFDTSSFLLPLNEYVNDPEASEEWKAEVEKYAALVSENYTGFPEGALTCAEYMKNAEPGFDLYVTEDGIHFETITTDGFGDPYNHGLRAYAEASDGFYVGTANPFYGTQVWRLSDMEATESTEGTESAGDTEEAESAEETSPQTGTGSPVILFAVVAAVCGVSAYVLYKKSRQNETKMK